MTAPTLAVLSIQSHVAYGHVGNASAVFPMQRLGVEVWPIHTVQFSNHPGYGAWRGRVFEAGLISELVEGIADRGVLGRCDAVLSGYMGGQQTGEAILDAVSRVKAANPTAIYACDPVIGDTGRGVYVASGLPEFIRERAVPAAQIITPNLFELEFLTGLVVTSLPTLRAALGRVHVMGPRIVLVTSVLLEDTPAGSLDLIASAGGALYRLRTPKLACDVNGAGDAIAALFLVHCLRTNDPAFALRQAGSSIHGVLRQTVEAGSREILSIAAQDEFETPSRMFEVERL
jgi:pyridoxine kinase